MLASGVGSVRTCVRLSGLVSSSAQGGVEPNDPRAPVRGRCGMSCVRRTHQGPLGPGMLPNEEMLCFVQKTL